jgi:hypothetical protein
MENLNPQKLNRVEGKEKYNFEISSRFAALQNFDAEMDANRAWESTREDIKILTKDSISYYEMKIHKP